MKTYADKLRSPKWQRKRLEAMQRDDFACKLCGDKDTTLNVHHLKYTGEPYEAPLEDLETLCDHCHAFRHSFPDKKIEKLYKHKWWDCYVMIYNEDGFTIYLRFTYETNKLVNHRAFVIGSDFIKNLYELNNQLRLDVEFLEGFDFNDFGGYDDFLKLFEKAKIFEDNLALPRGSDGEKIELFLIISKTDKIVKLKHTGGGS